MGNIRKNNNQSGIIYSADGISPTLDARGSKDPVKIVDTVGGGTDRVEQIGNIFPTKTRDNPNQGRVYDTDYIAPALNCMGGGNREPYIVETEVLNAMDDGTCRPIKSQYQKNSLANFTRKGSMAATGVKETVIYVGNVNPSGKGMNGKVIDSDGIARTISIEKGEGQKVLVREPISCAMRGRGDNNEQRIEISGNTYANSLTTTTTKDSMVLEPQDTGTVIRERIRKLMPIECFRLQGFDDESFHKAESVCSNSQLYKQAGNSITVDVLCYIFRALDDAKNGIEKYNADKNGQYTFF